MDDLVQWLGEQLDMDERIARAVTTEGAWRVGSSHGGASVEGEGWTVAGADALDGAHIAEHDPARVMREIDAKRQLLADLRTDEHGMSSCSARFHCGAAQDDYGNRLGPDDFARRTHPCDCGRDERVYRRVRLLALPYADRPGYKETWRL